ncbi:unnamed protein product [Caenorhabditis auriculariae]|uniref:Uncharacterized protein n=1 Tax=Caenorhabditis auriculariae TaxID=2777116 RepID=A0A8S1HP65_9PELO|nr:unnamed protein product [Caenorhabditis auriculariae]
MVIRMRIVPYLWNDHAVSHNPEKRPPGPFLIDVRSCRPFVKCGGGRVPKAHRKQDQMPVSEYRGAKEAADRPGFFPVGSIKYYTFLPTYVPSSRGASLKTELNLQLYQMIWFCHQELIDPGIGREQEPRRAAAAALAVLTAANKLQVGPLCSVWASPTFHALFPTDSFALQKQPFLLLRLLPAPCRVSPALVQPVGPNNPLSNYQPLLNSIFCLFSSSSLELLCAVGFLVLGF